MLCATLRGPIHNCDDSCDSSKRAGNRFSHILQRSSETAKHCAVSNRYMRSWGHGHGVCRESADISASKLCGSGAEAASKEDAAHWQSGVSPHSNESRAAARTVHTGYATRGLFARIGARSPPGSLGTGGAIRHQQTGSDLSTDSCCQLLCTQAMGNRVIHSCQERSEH